jgi:tRNA-dihydrouridine synthase
LGSPWVFAQIKAYIEEGKIMPEPELPERMEIMLKQVKLACEYKGEYAAMREARSHAAWYLKGMPGAAELRRDAGQVCAYEDIERLVSRITD